MSNGTFRQGAALPSEGPTPIHQDGLAADKAAQVGAQVGDQASNGFWLAQAVSSYEQVRTLHQLHDPL